MQHKYKQAINSDTVHLCASHSWYNH